MITISKRLKSKRFASLSTIRVFPFIVHTICVRSPVNHRSNFDTPKTVRTPRNVLRSEKYCSTIIFFRRCLSTRSFETNARNRTRAFLRNIYNDTYNKYLRRIPYGDRAIRRTTKLLENDPISNTFQKNTLRCYVFNRCYFSKK